MEVSEVYDKVLAAFPDIPRKGKNNPYTSMNGNMFSFINKDGCLAFRVSKDAMKQYHENFNPDPVISYGATMREYIKITPDKFDDLEHLKYWFKRSLEHAHSLKPKPTKKKK